MGYAWEYLERLSAFPHRGSATPEEAAAAEAARDWFQALGYEVEVQPFLTPKDTLYLGPFVVSLGMLLAAWTGLRLPWGGLVICAMFLAPLVGELLCIPWLDLDWLVPRHRSQNVIARKPAVSGADSPRRTVVITGHYDTQRATWLFHPRMVRWLQVYFFIVYGLFALLPMVLFFRMILPEQPWTGQILIGDSILIALNAVFLLLCWRSGGYINGANDNGSGAALVLALARHFAQEELPGTDLIFVLTGAEEVGTRGMKAFMRQARFDPKTTVFINLDNLGGGTLHYLTGEGMLTVFPYSPQLTALAEEVARETGTEIRPKPNLLLPTDGLIPSKAGYHAISFLAFLKDGSLPNYHWYTDTLDQVDRDLLEAEERFLVAYVRRTAAGLPEAA
ncbi:MAG TPA: M28 family peptidase [Symbiobacteriaceae bacterium]